VRILALICLLFFSAAGQERKPLPEFSLPRLNGRTVSSQELKDNIVVLDFWATWCAPCVSEIPRFNKLQAKYGSRGVRVIGLAVQSGWASDIRKFVARHRMRYTVLVGDDQTVADFEAIGFPTTYLVAPGWKVFKKYSGSEENKVAEIERDIETLLKAK
jgi:cytochrome c biogenesis protein CcmG/thiol:disulfide interchange protein DsbE